MKIMIHIVPKANNQTCDSFRMFEIQRSKKNIKLVFFMF